MSGSVNRKGADAALTCVNADVFAPCPTQLVINTVNPDNAATTLKVIKVCASYIYVIDQVGYCSAPLCYSTLLSATHGHVPCLFLTWIFRSRCCACIVQLHALKRMWAQCQALTACNCAYTLDCVHLVSEADI